MSKSLFPTGPIGNLIAFQTGGGTPSRQNPAYWTGPIPWASVKDFDEDKIELLETDEQISQQGLNNSATNLIPANTPVVCTRMAVGRVAIAPMDIAINQDLKALFPSRSTDTRYLLRLADYAKAKADAVSVGSTVKGIKVADYLNIEVPLAPPEHQSKIAEILDTLDMAIRGTEAVVAKLKAMKQGLLHDLLTRGIDANGDLRPSQSEAPHLYKQTPLGWLPKEWDYSTMGNVITSIDSGWSPACIENRPMAGEWGVLKVSAVTWGFYNDQQAKTLPPSLKPRPALEVQNGDVILTRANGVAALVGKTVQVQNTQERLMLSDKLLRLVPDKKKMTNDFLVLLMTSDSVVRQIEKSMSGSSGQKNISQSQIRSFSCLVPDVDEQTEIGIRVSSFKARIKAEEKELAKLRLLKSGLMDDLLMGKTSITPLL